MSKKKQNPISNQIKNEIKEEPSYNVTKVLKRVPKTLNIITYFFLALSFVTTVTLFIYTICTSSNITSQLSTIIGVSFLVLFSIFFLFTALYASSKKGQIFVIIASILLTCFTGFELLSNVGIIDIQKQNTVINFTNKNLTEVISWGQKNKISINQVYEASDSIKEYHIINQDVSPGTLTKKITNLKVTVSTGPDKTKEILFPSMLGKKIDEVITFIEENYFTNVSIDFVTSSEEKDLVLTQDKSGQLKRDSEIHLTVSLGTLEDLTPLSIEDLTNKSLFYATTWCKRHLILYKIEYAYSDTVPKGQVISQSLKKGETVTPKTDTVTLTISKGNKIIVPNLMNMDINAITKWIIENGLRIEFTDQYDDNILIGKPISVNVKENDIIEVGTTIKILISKGQLKMEKFKTIKEYRDWAIKYNIAYKEEIEFSNTYLDGEVIKVTPSEGQVIKNNETIIITVSQGKQITVPNFIGKSKNTIQKECNNLGLTCTFIYGNYSESVNRDISTNQSKKEGSKIAASSTVTITLSKGIIEKVTVPSFIGQNNKAVTNTCNSLGITCKFITEEAYSSTPAGNVTKQSASGKMNKGSTITLYISKGPAKTYNINIQATWFGSTYNETEQNLKNKLISNCPGVNFIFQAKIVNEGSGLISSNSPIKVGANTFVQGNTYTIIINK
ncbi:MAG: PASTA domain-containing protein [Bacilli bacterium]